MRRKKIILAVYVNRVNIYKINMVAILWKAVCLTESIKINIQEQKKTNAHYIEIKKYKNKKVKYGRLSVNFYSDIMLCIMFTWHLNYCVNLNSQYIS